MARPHEFKRPKPPKNTEPRRYNTEERVKNILWKTPPTNPHPQGIIRKQYETDRSKYGEIVDVKICIDRVDYWGSLIYSSKEGLHLTTGDGTPEILEWTQIADAEIWTEPEHQPHPAQRIIEAARETLQLEHTDGTRETLRWPQVTVIYITTYSSPEPVDELIQYLNKGDDDQ